MWDVCVAKVWISDSNSGMSCSAAAAESSFSASFLSCLVSSSFFFLETLSRPFLEWFISPRSPCFATQLLEPCSFLNEVFCYSHRMDTALWLALKIRICWSNTDRSVSDVTASDEPIPEQSCPEINVVVFSEQLKKRFKNRQTAHLTAGKRYLRQMYLI